MKKLLSVFLAALMIASVFTGCVPAPEGNDTQEPEIVEPTPPPYTPNPWTGYERAADFNTDMRATAVMVNNISAARPQRGLSQANVLYESKVEGGITRFMAIFEDYTKLEGDVGPVRSGRDQFLQWAMPYYALYCHVGRSEITQTYINTFDYNQYDVDGANKPFIYRRNRPGKAYEHTAYTNAELLQEVIDKNEINMNKFYNEPIFDFVDYDLVPGGERELVGEPATEVSIVHSEAYRTYFTYDEASGKYLMSQYNGSKGIVEDTIDENNGVQLSFENVMVLFSDISTYPYPGGNPKGDPNYQNLFLDWGYKGYYFANGTMERIEWGKGGPPDPLYFTDRDGNPIEINCGKTYIAFVDDDEKERFQWAAPGQEIEEEEVDMSQVVEEEIGED